MKEQNIEKLFNDALGNLEADVNPDIWTNIGQGLQTPVPVNPVSGSSIAVKSAGFLGKIGVKSLLLISAATVTLIGAVYLLAEKTEPFSENRPVISQNTIQSPATVENPVEPSVSNSVQVTKPGKVATQKTEVRGINKPVLLKDEKTLTPGKSIPAAEKVSGSNKSSIIQDPVSTNSPKQVKSTLSDPVSFVDPSVESEPAQPDVITKEDAGTITNPAFDANIENYLVSDDGTSPKLPNVFTPNNDNLNDVFKIKTINLKSLEVTIFDNKGNKIYSWKSLNGEWDGKFSNGSEAPSGNYFYSLNGESLDGKICIAQSSLRLTRNLK